MSAGPGGEAEIMTYVHKLGNSVPMHIYLQYLASYVFYSNEAMHQRKVLDDNYNTTG